MKNERPIIQMSLDGEFIKEFSNMANAAKQFGGSKKTYNKINYAAMIASPYNGKDGNRILLKNKTNEAFGYKWKFKEN